MMPQNLRFSVIGSLVLTGLATVFFCVSVLAASGDKKQDQAPVPAAPGDQKQDQAPDPVAPGVKNLDKAPGYLSSKVLEKDPARGCTWVEAKDSAMFNLDYTRYQAEAAALQVARARAVEALGVKVQESFFNFQQESRLKQDREGAALTQSLLRMTQQGHIISEEILVNTITSQEGCNACWAIAHIRACVMPLPDNSDKEFRINLEMNRGQHYEEGDEAVISIKSTRDAYIYIYSVYTEGKEKDLTAILLFPNAYDKSNFVQAGKEFTFPDEKHKKQNLRIKAELLPGTTMSVEAIQAYASKTELSPTLYDPGAQDVGEKGAKAVTEMQGKGSFYNLLGKLHRANVQWVEAKQVFTISKK